MMFAKFNKLYIKDLIREKISWLNSISTECEELQYRLRNKEQPFLISAHQKKLIRCEDDKETSPSYYANYAQDMLNDLSEMKGLYLSYERVVDDSRGENVFLDNSEYEVLCNPIKMERAK